MNLFIVLCRTFIFYFIILFSYRIMGKREFSQLSISDFTISMLIAELVAISIENRNESILYTLLPIFLLVFLEIIFSFIELKFNRVTRVINGKPSVIIKKGKLNIKEMIKQRYNIDELLLSLRENSISSIKDVNYAILETNGKLSIFKNIDDKSYPLPIVVNGKVDNESLLQIDKSSVWLNKILYNANLNLSDISYAFYKNHKIYFIKKF